MYTFNDCLQSLARDPAFSKTLPLLQQQLEQSLASLKHGDLEKWQVALKQVPHKKKSSYQFSDCIEIGAASDLSEAEQQQLESALKQFCPWRKGPFQFYGLKVDTEWRSDWKWQRIQNHIRPLKGKKVLDVGCGNGYHLWRMHEAGASLAIGIDPSPLFWYQFQLVKDFFPEKPVFFLPLKSEQLPPQMEAFDSVFSMGVLYHRRSPLDHLLELKDALKPGGELILETLIIKDNKQNILFPKDRYAMMPNVFFIPGIPLLTSWLERCGFSDIKVININQTSIEEQHSTAWIESRSLESFLDPDDHSLTIEGYPAPLRASLLATKTGKEKTDPKI